MTAPPRPLTSLRGRIERITYAGEDTGYTVARVQVPGQRELATVVGHLMAPMPGEELEMRGEWVNHPKYGPQFRVHDYRSAAPSTVVGIRKYLGSGLIRGIGPKIAERIVDEFGPETLDVIEERVEDLTRVEGIGKKRVESIRKAWADQKEIREVMLFLQSHGVSSGYATKIFKHYGRAAIATVQENPYRLAMDIFGIGFLTADRIAEKLGITPDSPLRLAAGAIYTLHQLADEGHVYYPYEPLIERCREILAVDREGIVSALAELSLDRRIAIEDLATDFDDLRENQKAVYLAKYHHCEVGVANRLKILLQVPKSVSPADPDGAIDHASAWLDIRLAPAQVEAVRSALTHKVLVITGGPGTGKTTIIHAILKIFAAADVRIQLAAPTGRAAKRMSEATGHEAKTIHRLLEFSPANGAFGKNFDHPLPADLLIIDEASMIDTVLAYHLLQAVSATATLIFVGDVNQLPSVGPGNVLSDIIASNAVAVVTLTEIFRQARQSRIIVNAHRINAGRMPYYDPNTPETDFFFIQKEDPEAVREIIITLVAERIPRRFGLDPVDDIQVITPMHRGAVGAGSLNEALQTALNPEGGGTDAIVRGSRRFRAGDKVMQIRNNYDKAVFNGDIGRVLRTDAEAGEMTVRFDGREVIYDATDLDELVLAYAITIHKAQGSEFPAVVIPLLTQHYVLLQRNLIYTAVTRGRRLVVVVGSRKAMAIAVKNDRRQGRFTRLAERLDFRF
jgi:exodeoxyribonuclease V alpha subunit